MEDQYFTQEQNDPNQQAQLLEQLKLFPPPYEHFRSPPLIEDALKHKVQ